MKLTDGINLKTLWERVPIWAKRALGPVLRRLPDERIYGASYRQAKRNLDQLHNADPSTLLQWHAQSLRRILKAAGQTKNHALLGKQPLEHMSDEAVMALFFTLPTMDKAAIRSAPDDYRNRTETAPSDWTSTGGSNGQPFYFYINRSRSGTEVAHLQHLWSRIGYNSDIPLVVLRGYETRSQRLVEFDPVLNRYYFDAMTLSAEKLSTIASHIAELGPCYLHAYPSAASMFASVLAERGQALSNVCGVILESEALYDHQKALLRQVFKNVISCYGHTEKCVLASWCNHHDTYHFEQTYGFAELLDETGKPITTPGQRGEIVGTSYINTAQPFVRYRTGDHATFVANHCDSCGHRGLIVEDIRGHRVQEFLIGRDGFVILWTAMNLHDRNYEGVHQFQFEQFVPGEAVLNVVPSQSLPLDARERVVNALAARFAEKVRGQINIRVQTVDALQTTGRGKAIFVRQHLKLTGNLLEASACAG